MSSAPVSNEFSAGKAWRRFVDSSPAVRLLGFPATVIHGTTTVLDRWMWLRSRLPKSNEPQRLLEVGCGSGAFTIGSTLRGYASLGLSWDERNQRVASERAQLCGAANAAFDVVDVRQLDARPDLVDAFDVIICSEVVEHILDDAKLMRDMARCLKEGGRLLLTTPYLHHSPVFYDAPISKTEDGGHVRRGYSESMLRDLCNQAGLVPDEVSFCTGLLSQMLSLFQRTLSRVHPIVGWGAVLPLRAIPPAIDRPLTDAFGWPYLSVCLVAHKPRRP